MIRLSGRVVLYAGSLLALVAIYTTLYRWGMATLEGEQRTWYGAFEIVIQSMTTTGYGQDAPWESPEMTALMVAIQLTGITYIFVAFPLFVVPWLRTLVQPTPPERVEGLSDHVVIVGYTERCAMLVDELESKETPYVVLEADEEHAQELHDDGIVVLHGDPSTDEALEAAYAGDALAIVIDATEEEYISTILAIDELNPDVPVLAIIEDQTRARYLRYAGVDEVLSPKHRIGKALGDKVRGVIDVDLTDANEGDSTLNIAEFPIDRDSEFFDVPLDACQRIEDWGVTVLGVWVRGDFLRTLSSDVRTDENTTLLVTGTAGQLDAVADEVGSRGRRYRSTPDPVIVIGAGVIGSTVVGGLERAGLETVFVEGESATTTELAIDPETEETVHEPDIVGDPTIEETLHDADIEEARTVVLALENDEDAILASLVAREINPDTRLLAAVGREANVSRLRATGVDYVLAIPNVTGRMITRNIFEGDEMTFDEHINLVRIDGSALVGTTLVPDRIRAETGCTVVAIERGGKVSVDVADHVVESDEYLLVAGADDELETFREWGRDVT